MTKTQKPTLGHIRKLAIKVADERENAIRINSGCGRYAVKRSPYEQMRALRDWAARIEELSANVNQRIYALGQEVTR